MKKRSFPLFGWIGILIVSVFWILNWALTGLRTQWGFFPLWLGYCLTINALFYYRKTRLRASSRHGGQAGLRASDRRESRLRDLEAGNIKSYFFLFIISMPCWWLFEFFNLFTKNWFYDGSQYFSNLEYFLLASLSFSTVMPAIFGTAELASTFKWVKKLSHFKKFSPGKKSLIVYWFTGLVIVTFIILYPGYFYPFIWVSVYLIIEPINVWLKNRSLFDFTSKGDWSIVASLAAAGLICGFFWEMWNYYSYPKWIYNLPGLNFIHIFEMPVLGFLGYIPFSFELFAVYNLVTGLLKFKEKHVLTDLK